MATVCNVEAYEDLCDILATSFQGTPVTYENVKVRPYCYDGRIGWDTYIVTIDGYGVAGFTDGPLWRANEKADQDITPKATEWQPIATAPRDGTRILVRLPGDAYAVIRWSFFLWRGEWTVYREDEHCKTMRWLRGPIRWLTVQEPLEWRAI